MDSCISKRKRYKTIRGYKAIQLPGHAFNSGGRSRRGGRSGGEGGGGDVLAIAPLESSLAVLCRDGRLCLLPECGPGRCLGPDPPPPATAGSIAALVRAARRVVHGEDNPPLVSGRVVGLAGGGLASVAEWGCGQVRVRIHPARASTGPPKLGDARLAAV